MRCMKLFNTRNKQAVEFYGANLYTMVVEYRNCVFDMGQKLQERIIVAPDVVVDLDEQEEVTWAKLQHRQVLVEKQNHPNIFQLSMLFQPKPGTNAGPFYLQFENTIQM